MTVPEAKENMLEIMKLFIEIENETDKDFTQYIKDCEKVMADFDDMVWRVEH